MIFREAEAMRSTTLTAALLLAATAPAFAQDARPSATSELCPDGVIASIHVVNHSIFDTRDPSLDDRFGWAYRLANRLHFRTRESVIRGELLFRVGDCHDPLLLQESERLLRASGLLSRADILALPHSDGGHHVVVETRDEWSTQIDLQVETEDGPSLRGARLRESNLLGTGRSLELFYLTRDANRDYGIGFGTPQLLGTRWDLSLATGRTRAGHLVGQSLAYPFAGEFGRWAAKQSFGRHDRFFEYTAHLDGRPMRLLLPIRATGFELAAAGRFGDVGNTVHLGAALSHQSLDYPGGAGAVRLVEAGDYDDDRPAGEIWTAPILRQLESVESLRFYLLFGRRRVTWVKRQGFDSLRGDQDIRLGSEIEVALGHSLSRQSGDDGVHTTLSLYRAAERNGLLTVGRLRVDGRHEADGGPRGWRDIFADTEFFAYLRPAPDSRHTVVFRAAGTGAWRTRTPFQLTLGGDVGVRGYDRDRFPAGRTVLFTLEDRIDFGQPLTQIFDLGATAFLDVGRGWAADAPFGIDSGWKAAAGIGLRGAFPSGGRTTYRVDLAIPLEGSASLRDLRLVLSVGELVGLVVPARRERIAEARPLRSGTDAFLFR